MLINSLFIYELGINRVFFLEKDKNLKTKEKREEVVGPTSD